MISFVDVLLTVIFLLILTIPTFALEKLNALPKNASETLSTIVLYGCQPVLIITSFQNCSFSNKIALNMAIVAGIAFALHFLFFGILKIAFYKHAQEDKIKIIKYVSVFSNCGFMGLPFLQSLFSDSGIQAEVLIYCAIIIVVFQVLNWTCGVYIMTGDKKDISIKKTLVNPVIISVVLGLLMFVLIKKPLIELAEVGTFAYKILTKLTNSLNFVSNMVTPLSMFVIGIRLANISLKQLFLNKLAYLSSAIKLVIMPLVVILCVSYLPISSAIKYTVFFLLSMPSATSGVMMAVRFNNDSDFASVCVLLSTILCTVTLPLLYMFMNGVLRIPL